VKQTLRLILRGLPVLLSLALIGLLVRETHLAGMLDQAWVDREVRGRGLDGELLYIGIGALATAVGFPRQVVSFMGGYAFGFLQGTLYGVLATLLGCVATFAYARLFGRSLLAPRLSGRIGRMDDFVRGHPFTMTLLIRLLPVGSNVLTSLVAGLSGVAAAPFLLGSALGFVPQTAVFALVGSGAHVDPVWRIGLGITLFVLSGLLGVHLYRRLRHGKVYDEALERGLDS
jgi:uncharacterized membrane protein YdjX (TVP38/TMEM64 family)